MGLVTRLQREGRAQVLLEQGGLLDGGQQSGVDLLLVVDSFGLDFLLGGVFVEEGGFGLLVLGGLFAGEVGDVELGDVDTGDVDLGRGGNDVSGVDSSQGDTVDLEGTGDQQGVVFEVLKVHHSLAAETTGEEDEHGTRGDRGPELVGTSNLSRNTGDAGVLGTVELGRDQAHGVDLPW